MHQALISYGAYPAKLGELDLCWIPAHVDYGGNEVCSQAVKHALRSDFETQIPLCPLNRPRQIWSQIDNNKKKWQFQWETSTKGRCYCEVHPLVESSVSLPFLSRRDQIILYGLTLRHFGRNSYLHKIGYHRVLRVA